MNSATSEFDQEQFRYRPDTRGTIRAMGIDQYPGEMPIVRELLQNADDAGATYFRIHQDNDELVIIHDGKPFTKPSEVENERDSDFIRISRIGLGKTEESTTGRFGIGFTSVFHVSDHPRIVSNGWDFTINVDEYPTHKEVPLSKETRIHLPYRKTHTPLSESIGAEPFDNEKIQSFRTLLPNELYQDIFFLKNITQISSFQNDEPQVKISRKITNTIIEDVLIINEAQIEIIDFKNKARKKTESWKYFSIDNLSIPQHLQSLGRTQNQRVEIALPISRNWKIPSRIHLSQHYAYYTLPVKQSIFNFKCNSSMFYTTSGRADFVTKEGTKKEWNKWQSDNIARVSVLSIQYLIKREFPAKYLYTFFPDLGDTNNPMDSMIAERFREIVFSDSLPFFFSSSENWYPIQSVVKNWNGLSILVRESPGHVFLNEKLKRYDTLFTHLSISSVGISYLITYLEETYGTQRDDEGTEDPHRLMEIYEYLGKIRLSSENVDKLRSINIILSEENILRNYQFGIYLPTDNEMPLIHPGDIIKKETYQSRTALNFLKHKLKIKNINIHSLICDSFLLRLSNYDQSQIDDFIWYLVKNQGKVFRRKSTVSELKSKFFDLFICEKNHENTDIFFDSGNLKDTFGDSINYLSSEYESKANQLKLNWRRFFTKLGVQQIPNARHLVTVFSNLESHTFTKDYIPQVKSILKYIELNWKKAYSRQRRIINEVSTIKWAPTQHDKKERPTDVYIRNVSTKLVGEEHPFCSVNLPSNTRIRRALGFKQEPELDHLIDQLINLSQGGQKPSYRIYSYLDKKASELASYQIQKLVTNPIIYFKKQYWYPRELFVKDQSDLFGRNGWIRGYLKKNPISKLSNLCQLLRIKDTANSLGDFVSWLTDYSNEFYGTVIPKRHRNLLFNLYSTISKQYPAIDDTNLDRLQKASIILTEDNNLVQPSDTFLIRNSDRFVFERLKNAGFRLETVVSDDIEMDSFFNKIGVRNILPTIHSTNLTMLNAKSNNNLSKRFQEMLPWLDGFEYMTLGSVSDHNLIFKDVNVYVQPELEVNYHIDNFDFVSKSIPDVCCVEHKDSLTIWLSNSFSLGSVDHINLLSILLIRFLNSEIEHTQWSLIIPTLLNTKQLFGVSQYFREKTQIGPEEEPLSPPRERTRSITRRQVQEPQKIEDEVISEWEPVIEPTDQTDIQSPKYTVPWDPIIEPFDFTEIEEFIPVTDDPPSSPSYGFSTSQTTDMNIEGESHSQIDQLRVGSWGELFALNAVRNEVHKQYPAAIIEKVEIGYRLIDNNQEVALIEWLNKKSEQGLPYDILVKAKAKEQFYEVKSTTTTKKDWFRVSKNQWAFAQENDKKYSILRVYNVGTSEANIIKYNDPYRLWQEGKINARATEIYL